VTGARAGLRLLVSVGVLALLARALDGDAVIDRLRGLRAEWVLIALALTVPQALALAWRWRFTAGRLGVSLPLRMALSEYYLGNFLNQVLPGGVSGDVVRALRHARSDVPAGSAVRAVVLERLSAQAFMTCVAVVSVMSLPALTPALRVAAAAVLALSLLAVLRSARGAVASAVGVGADHTGRIHRLWSDAHLAVFHPDARWVHAATALFTVSTYIAVYLCAAEAVGTDAPWSRLAPLVAPVLMTMLLPITVAGWGIREAAAAGLWAAVGLSAEDGVAISVAYGVLVLVSTAPGAVVLIGMVLGGRGRTGRRPRV
jgi:uncharacterized membrane protein YbhN (UPF0104 family)